CCGNGRRGGTRCSQCALWKLVLFSRGSENRASGSQTPGSGVTIVWRMCLAFAEGGRLMPERNTAANPKQKKRPRRRPRTRPTWEIAYLFPRQGQWTEDDYFALEGHYEGWPRIELSRRRLEVLPMPTTLHQCILGWLLTTLNAFANAHAAGVVL